MRDTHTNTHSALCSSQVLRWIPNRPAISRASQQRDETKRKSRTISLANANECDQSWQRINYRRARAHTSQNIRASAFFTSLVVHIERPGKFGSVLFGRLLRSRLVIEINAFRNESRRWRARCVWAFHVFIQITDILNALDVD